MSATSSPSHTLEGVAGPLRVTVGNLVNGIERRQRGLDAAQEEVQAKIAGLLQEDWFGAVARSEKLLEDTTGTLQELNEVLLREVQSRSPADYSGRPTRVLNTPSSRSSSLGRKFVADTTGCFVVPSYQRGYRWGPYEVLALLNDIWDNGAKGYST